MKAFFQLVVSSSNFFAFSRLLNQVGWLLLLPLLLACARYETEMMMIISFCFPSDFIWALSKEPMWRWTTVAWAKLISLEILHVPSIYCCYNVQGTGYYRGRSELMQKLIWLSLSYWLYMVFWTDITSNMYGVHVYLQDESYLANSIWIMILLISNVNRDHIYQGCDHWDHCHHDHSDNTCCWTQLIFHIFFFFFFFFLCQFTSSFILVHVS